jgi:hypothetical protein
VPLLSDEAEWGRSLPRPAFSNGFEADSWMGHWCFRCKIDAEDACPLVMVAFLGHTPALWLEDQRDGLADRYTCPEFVPL